MTRLFPDPELSIIVPTFREVENLRELVERISAALQPRGIAAEIVIVDDNSRDGTEELCAELAQSYPVRLIVRTTDRGLSSAVIEGMNQARGEFLIVMDADLSHPPEKLPELLAALQEPGTEFVIGSRYTTGGEVEQNWGVFRQLNSSVAGWLARPLTRTTDPMAGFFGLRRQRFLDVQPMLNPVGYKIGLELLVKTGAKQVREIPIFFADRKHGESKLSFKEQLNYLRHLGRLMEFRYPVLVQMTKFVSVGLTGMVLDLSLYALLMTMMPFQVARALAIWTAMSWNFLWNRRVTFHGARTEGWFRQYLRFCGSCLLGALVNFLVSVLLGWLPWFAAGRRVLAGLIGVLCGFAFNFTLCRLFVFRNRPVADAARKQKNGKE